jgi:predicted transcriptional regulator
MDQFGLSSSTIKKAVEGLLEKDVIDRLQGQYYLQDPLFEHYIKMKF